MNMTWFALDLLIIYKNKENSLLTPTNSFEERAQQNLILLRWTWRPPWWNKTCYHQSSESSTGGQQAKNQRKQTKHLLPCPSPICFNFLRPKHGCSTDEKTSFLNNLSDWKFQLFLPSGHSRSYFIVSLRFASFFWVTPCTSFKRLETGSSQNILETLPTSCMDSFKQFTTSLNGG